MRRRPERTRLLTTVLFTDIVDSTKRATELGDARWRQLLARHHTAMRRELKRHRGREIDTAGDGFFATFDQPSDAIRCAEAMIAHLRPIGLEIRAGVHMGEVEAMGAKVSGIAVHVGARVMSKAGAGQILISSTVRELLSGSDLEFTDAGVHELKGVDARVHLFSIRRPVTAESEHEVAETEGPRRRRWPLVAGAAVVVASGLTALLLTRGDDADSYAPAPNTIARLDPTTGEVIGGVEVGTTPTLLTFGDGRLWVANFDDRTVQSIDVSSGTAAAAQGGVLANPTGIATGGGFVWITNGFAGQLVKLDPRQPNDMVPLDVGSGAAGVAYGFDHVWVAQPNEGVLLRIDPLNDEIERVTLPDGADPKDVAIGEELIWVADELGSRAFGVDPDTLTVERTVSLRAHPTRIATGGGFVWATSTQANSLIRIDPNTGQTTTVADIGNGPLGVAADASGVWVANSRDGSVVRVDPNAARIVDRIELAAGPDDIAITPDGIWVSLHDL
jgi:class 3 adenylate cyclase